METVGVLVDQLYPRGALKLQDRLLDAVSGYSDAFVVPGRDNRPLALASEVTKGPRAAKLCTFWVDASVRGQGVGRALLTQRQSDWLGSDLERVHVTVREERAQELEGLFVPRGFSRSLVVLNRYGEGNDEVVLTWRPPSAEISYPAAG